LMIQTHDAGGITERDFELADAIEDNLRKNKGRKQGS
jgi:pterin-4a-carbinolamine dehydratase